MLIMINKEEIINKLKKVMDPELGMNIIDANMIRNISIDEKNSVKIVLALTSPSCPLSDKIKEDIISNLREIQGINNIEVVTEVMPEEEARKLLSKAMIRKFPKMNIKRIIAILSGKGGVGKSSITSLIAVTLVNMGYKVGILDADITGSSISKIFGVKETPFVVEGKIIPPKSKKGIKIMSMNLIIPDEESPVIWRGPLISSAIRQFYTDVDWGELDYLLIDLPPGTSDAQLTVMQILPLDGVIIVTSPQELVGTIVAKAMNMSISLGIPILGVIENMSYITCPKCGEKISIFGESKGKIIAEKINTKFLGSIPIDPKLTIACDKGIIEDYENKEIFSILKEIMETISQ